MEPTSAFQQPARRAEGCYTMEPDLSVVVEGEVVPVYSQVLMSSSPVFEKMLSTRMVEGDSGKVDLLGKTKSEFEVFWNVLLWKVEVTKDNSMFLSIWTDEYAIEGLKKVCEENLMQHVPCNCSALEHAIKYHMPQREAQCLEFISKDIRSHIQELTSMGELVSVDLMQKVWPSICNAAGMDVVIPDGFNPAHALWPFVVKAVISIPLETAKGWPYSLYSILPRTNGVYAQARTWLQDARKPFEQM